MTEIFSEIFTVKFLVITIIIGLAISITGNLLTPFLSAYCAFIASWIRQNAKKISVVSLILGCFLLLGIAIPVNEKQISPLFMPLASIGAALIGVSFIVSSFLLGIKDAWKEGNLFIVGWILIGFAMGCVWFSVGVYSLYREINLVWSS